jgi:hypothetical protein
VQVTLDGAPLDFSGVPALEDPSEVGGKGVEALLARVKDESGKPFADDGAIVLISGEADPRARLVQLTRERAAA